MSPVPRPDDLLARVRRAARGAIPGASDDLLEEVADHLAQRWLDARAAGASVPEADATARSELDAWRPRTTRARWRVSMLWAGWRAEATRAARGVLRRPLFAVSIAFLTAVAVGAIVAAFTVVYGLLWRPLPYPNGDRLAVVWQVQRGTEGQVSYPDYRDLTTNPIFAAATAIDSGTGSLRVHDRIERVNVLEVEPQGLSLLGARPALGRLLGPDDRGTPNVLISHRLWQTQFGGSRDILGRALWLSGRTAVVAGVLAPGSDFELPVGGTFRLEHQDLWTVLNPDRPPGPRRDVWTYEVLTLVRPGGTLDAAQKSIDAVAARLARDYPETNSNRHFRVAWLSDEVVRLYRRPVLLAGLAAAVALLTALANMLVLASVRLADRRQELTIRRALGAGAFRIRRQLLTEHAWVVAAGTAGGVVLARILVSAIGASEAAHLPRLDAIRVDRPAYLLAVALGAAISLALACLPSLEGEYTTALRAGDRAGDRARRARQVMVALELALALTLASGAALLGLSVTRLMTLDPGFAADGVLTLRVSAYAAEHAGRREVVSFFDSVLQSVRQLPGVEMVGAGSSLPLGGQQSGISVAAEGQPTSHSAVRPTAGWQVVTPDYFTALGIHFREGRPFTPDEVARDRHVTIINETLARMLFGAGSAVGRRLAIGGGDAQGDWHEVVGVVADTRHQGLATTPGPRVYDLFGQHWTRTLFVAARVRGGDPRALIAPIRRTVMRLDREAPVFQVAAMPDLVWRSAAPFRLSAAVALGLALTSVLLALAGAYATAAVSVAGRTREVGVRAALGASATDLMLLVFRDALRTASAGVLVGSLGAIAAARLLAAQLFGTQASDAALVIPVLTAALGAAAIAATVQPALRAARVDPLAAMRAE